MSRTILGLVLGGALMLIAAACGPQPTSDTISANVESPKAEIPGARDTGAQSSEGKPVVTVSRSPT